MKATLIAMDNPPRPDDLISQNNEETPQGSTKPIRVKGMRRSLGLLRVSPKDLEHQHQATPDESRPTYTRKAESLESTSFDALQFFMLSPLQGFHFIPVPHLPDANDTRSSTLAARHQLFSYSNIQ